MSLLVKELNRELAEAKAALDRETRRADALSSERMLLLNQRRDYLNGLRELLERSARPNGYYDGYNTALTSALSLFHETFRPRPSSMVGFLDTVYAGEGS